MTSQGITRKNKLSMAHAAAAPCKYVVDRSFIGQIKSPGILKRPMRDMNCLNKTTFSHRL